MGLVGRINQRLNNMPKLKRGIKRVYQRMSYTFSSKIQYEGDIIRYSPDDPGHEYFFGYYDKSPWDATDRFLICLKAQNTWSDVSPKDTADILIIDTALPEENPNRIKKIAETHSWNVQQGCMAQWLGPDYQSKIIYNDFRNQAYVSVILDISTGKERIIKAPIYSVSSDGKTALTLDFSRLYNLRPGYGYYNIPERTENEGLPDSTAIWKIDLEKGNIEELLTYKDFSSFEPRIEMKDEKAIHKVNHIMISPNGQRFMVLYRWFVSNRKFTRLITCGIDGKSMYLLSDDNMVSHCFWKDDETILAFENKKDQGPGYYLMKDRTQEYCHCWASIDQDGHPSYSPDGTLIVTDTYPNKKRVSEIRIMNGENEKDNCIETIARVFSPFKYDNETRCDLHPRWNRESDRICFDSVYEGHRGLYGVSVTKSKENGNNKESEFDMKKIRFIMPLHGFFNQMVQKSGYDIRDPYYGNFILFRVFREIHFRLNLPLQYIWYNRENVTSNPIIIAFEPLLTSKYMQWLREKNPDAKIILSYINKVTPANSPDHFRFSWLSIWTGDHEDSQKYGIRLYDGISYFRIFKVNKTTPVYDIFFVGKDKGRMEELLKLEERFNQMGLKTYFHIVAERRYQLKRNKRYKRFMPYEEVIDNLGKTRSILHLVDGGQDGITIRVMESLIHKVKLITNNKNIVNYDFYNPSNIFILGVDKDENLNDFLSSPYEEVQSKYYDHMYFEEYIQHLVEHS